MLVFEGESFEEELGVCFDCCCETFRMKVGCGVPPNLSKKIDGCKKSGVSMCQLIKNFGGEIIGQPCII